MLIITKGTAINNHYTSNCSTSFNTKLSRMQCDTDIVYLPRIDTLFDVFGITSFTTLINTVNDSNTVTANVIFSPVFVGNRNTKTFSKDNIDIGKIVDMI